MRYSKALLASVLLVLQTSLTEAQSLGSIGTNGGSGPAGGLGDSSHPVKEAVSYITDAIIPDDLTNLGGARMLKKSDSPKKMDDNSSGGGNTRKVKVNAKSGKRQEILGFGHSWTDSTVDVFNQLSSEKYDQLMQDLFSQQGNNMGFMRHSIGSTDLSGHDYSFADGGNLDSFDLGKYGKAMAKMIADMGKYKSDVTLVGSPWSAPGWMKKNNKFISDGNGDNSFDTKHIDDYAEYFAKYIDAYKGYGVNINAITPQNEPLNDQTGYPTMHLSSEDESSLIKQKLAAKMKEKNVELWAYDHNTDTLTYPESVYGDNKDSVSGIAWHCYEPYSDYTAMGKFHQSNPEALQFMTECASTDTGGGNLDFNVANNFILPVQNYGSGATMWVMGTDQNFGPHTQGGCQNCGGSIMVKNGDYIKTHDYYMIGQFSRFIRRGAFNYEVTEGNEGSIHTDNQFYVLAEKNPDGSWAMVFMNNMRDDQEVELSFNDGTPSWKGTVPKTAVTTWVIPGSSDSNSDNAGDSSSSSAIPSSAGTSIPGISSSLSSIPAPGQSSTAAASAQTTGSSLLESLFQRSSSESMTASDIFSSSVASSSSDPRPTDGTVDKQQKKNDTMSSSSSSSSVAGNSTTAAHTTTAVPSSQTPSSVAAVSSSSAVNTTNTTTAMPQHQVSSSIANISSSIISSSTYTNGSAAGRAAAASPTTSSSIVSLNLNTTSTSAVAVQNSTSSSGKPLNTGAVSSTPSNDTQASSSQQSIDLLRNSSSPSSSEQAAPAPAATSELSSSGHSSGEKPTQAPSAAASANDPTPTTKEVNLKPTGSCKRKKQCNKCKKPNTDVNQTVALKPTLGVALKDN